MAIRKMKRLRLMVVRSEKEELLRQLIRRGCVEISEIGQELREEEAAGVVHREDSELLSLRSRQTDLGRAIELLEKYAPAKKGGVKELPGDAFLQEEGLATAQRVAAGILDAEEQIRRIGAEESRQRSVIESLQPWQSLELSLDTQGTERCAVLLGSLPVRASLEQVNAALERAAGEAELFKISADKGQSYVLLVCMKEVLPAAQECLRQNGFTPAAFNGLSGSARECALVAKEALQRLAGEKAGYITSITDAAIHREELKLAYDRLGAQAALAEAEGRLYGTESSVLLEGWMPAEREKELAGVFERYRCAWDSRDPTEEEYPQVPVSLKNNLLTNSLNMVTNMYSLPLYGTVDPNPLMAPFFILFFGLMMADMGYGLIMIAAAVVALIKLRPREGTLAFCQLLLYGGIATFLMGALTGSFFGDIPYQLVHLLRPESTWQGLPYLFSPVNNSTMVLYGGMVLGFIHLNTGVAVSFAEKWKHGDKAGAVLEDGALWVIFLGAVPTSLGFLLPMEVLKTVGYAVIILGVLLLIFGAGRSAKGFGKITGAFGAIYNTVTGWFGDILSYSRLMALMLAGAVIGQVFNTIAMMPLQGMGVTNPIAIVFALFIFLVGHALNFGLNLLGCFVHDLRLQCLEFFGKFYTDGGKPFEPLRLRGRFARPKEG